MFKWWSLLMTNTQILLLFALLAIDKTIWYFWIELTVFNLLLIYLVLRQENMSQSLLTLVTTGRGLA